jgi:hypothetical protein
MGVPVTVRDLHCNQIGHVKSSVVPSIEPLGPITTPEHALHGRWPTSSFHPDPASAMTAPAGLVECPVSRPVQMAGPDPLQTLQQTDRGQAAKAALRPKPNGRGGC